MAATAMASARSRASYFYVWMSILCAVFAFGGVAGAYWHQPAGETFAAVSPLLHLRSQMTLAWSVLLVAQAWQAANGRLAHHKALGVTGVSLAMAMVVVGVAVADRAAAAYLARGDGESARAFYLVPFESIVEFAVFFTAALANLTRPDWHKRLMVVATVALLQASAARIALLLAAGGGLGLRPGPGPLPPMACLGATAFVCLILLVGAIYDWRTRGRPHAAYLIGLVTLLGMELAHPWITGSPGWPAFVDVMGRSG